MQVQDDLYTGPVGPNGFVLVGTSGGNPTRQYGVGPLGRTVYRNIVPLTLQVNNVATVQASTAATAFTLTAGTGVTSGSAPDGSGRTVIIFDVARAVSLTSAGDLSAGNFLITGYDEYGAFMSQLRAGPNANTVNTLKAFKSVYQVIPSATSVTTASIGTSDIFGLPFRMINAVYIQQAKWDSTLAANAGTFVAADVTSPATTATGDVRGTFAQAGAASNGTRRLIIAMHVDASQCGPDGTRANAIGVTQV